MRLSYTYWRETDSMFLGYLNEFPDHWTQGVDIKDLEEHLIDLFKMLSDGDIPGIKRVAELEFA